MALQLFNPINFIHLVGQHLMYWENWDKGNDKEYLENVGPFLIHPRFGKFSFLRKPSLQRGTLFFYKHKGKLGWNSICWRFSQFEPEIMIDGMLNFKIHFMVWYSFDTSTAMASFKYSNLNIQLSLTWILQWSL